MIDGFVAWTLHHVSHRTASTLPVNVYNPTDVGACCHVVLENCSRVVVAWDTSVCSILGGVFHFWCIFLIFFSLLVWMAPYRLVVDFFFFIMIRQTSAWHGPLSWDGLFLLSSGGWYFINLSRDFGSSSSWNNCISLASWRVRSAPFVCVCFAQVV